MIQFFETMMGRRFYESHVPRIVRALEEIVKHLDKETCGICGAPLKGHPTAGEQIERSIRGDDPAPVEKPFTYTPPTKEDGHG